MKDISYKTAYIAIFEFKVTPEGNDQLREVVERLGITVPDLLSQLSNQFYRLGEKYVADKLDVNTDNLLDAICRRILGEDNYERLYNNGRHSYECGDRG